MALINNEPKVKQEVQNADWVRQAFFVPVRGGHKTSNSRVKEEVKARQFSYSQLNFADTSLGGNRSINPPYQFTSNADHDLPSVIAKVTTDSNPAKNATMGMGRYYAEAIDQNASRIYLQFGVPAFNSLTNFFTTFYDPYHGNMANSGRVGGDLLYTIGKYAGFITFWAVVPELALGSLLYGIGTKAIADLQRRPMSRFYYMRPAMPLYWSTVTTIVNAVAVNMKLAQGVPSGGITRDTNNGGKLSVNRAAFGSSEADIAELSKILPDIFLNDNGGIDVRRVANRYQRLNLAHEERMANIRDKATSVDEAKALIQAYIEGGGVQDKDVKDINTMAEYIQEYVDSAAGVGRYLLDKLEETFTGTEPEQKVDNIAKDATDAINKQATASISLGQTVANMWLGLTQHMADYATQAGAELRDGSAFTVFSVDWESKTGESFNNRTKESEIANKMNETSRANRSRLNNIANGNISDNIIGNTLESIVGGVADVMGGVLSSIGLSGLSMLGGRAFVDMPEFWDESTTTLPTSTYTIKLRTPYGNPISILQDLIVPLAMLIAGVAPRTTGRNSYNGPFLCKLWQKGRVQMQLGMITDMTISRGTGNVGWNIQGQPLGIDINFTVSNMSKMLHVPITGELSTGDFTQGWISMFDEDTNFTDYMAVLGSLGVAEQYYATSRWRLRRARARQNFDSFLSMDNFISWGANETTVGSIMSAFVRGTIDQ